jgi:uncharacterized protein YndB with AHSA1/START domain
MGDTEFVIEPGRHDIVMARVFDAPRDVVFAAVTDPDLVSRWWGPRSLVTRVERMEVTPGGQWRVVQTTPQGEEYAFRGVYHDVVAPERIVRTWAFEDWPEDVALETVTLADAGGRTKYVAKSVHPSVEARDAIVRAGGPRGGQESMDRLGEVLADR